MHILIFHSNTKAKQRAVLIPEAACLYEYNPYSGRECLFTKVYTSKVGAKQIADKHGWEPYVCEHGLVMFTIFRMKAEEVKQILER